MLAWPTSPSADHPAGRWPQCSPWGTVHCYVASCTWLCPLNRLLSHSTAPTASPAACVPMGWWPMAKAAASLRPTAPVCTMRPATCLARPSGWAATHGMCGGGSPCGRAQPGQAPERSPWDGTLRLGPDGQPPAAPARTGCGSAQKSPAWPPARPMGMATSSPSTVHATASAGTASTHWPRYAAPLPRVQDTHLAFRWGGDRAGLTLDHPAP